LGGLHSTPGDFVFVCVVCVVRIVCVVCHQDVECEGM
jgi:hypothetical protein